MKYCILLILLNCACHGKSQAPMFEQQKLYPGVLEIKSQYSKGKGFGKDYNIQKLDSNGRIIEQCSYSGKTLISTETFEYNAYNHKIQSTSTSGEISYTLKNIFTYKNGIIARMVKYWGSDSTDFSEYILIEDSISSKRVYEKTGDLIQTLYVLSYDPKGRISSIAQLFTGDSLFMSKSNIWVSSEMKFAYNETGDLISLKTIYDIPGWEGEMMFTGGLWGDDMKYTYRYDSHGEIKTEFVTIDEKQYKIAKHRYTYR